MLSNDPGNVIIAVSQSLLRSRTLLSIEMQKQIQGEDSKVEEFCSQL